MSDALFDEYMAQYDDPDFEMEPPSCDAVRPGPHPMLIVAPRCYRWVGHTEANYPHDKHEYGAPGGAICWPVTPQEARAQRFADARREYGLPQIGEGA